jgi:hypothetical protein
MGEDIDGQMNSEGGGFPGGGVDISEVLFAQMFGGAGGGFQSSPFGSTGGPFGGGRQGHSHSHSHSQGFGF